MDQSTVPPPPADILAGEGVFEINLTNSATGAQLHSFTMPLTFTYHPTNLELERANGDVSRIRMAFWNGAEWEALSCTTSSGDLICPLAHLSLFRTLVVPATVAQPLEHPLVDGSGYFYKQTNGFNGAGEMGFAVHDDAHARFWSEFQRLGSVERLGYPISNRFIHSGFLTQAFQKQALQWRPELGTAVPVNIFDDLTQRGVDPWLDEARQVPPAWDTADDLGLSFEQVVERHVAFLDPYPSIKAFYLNTPNWLQTYGVPLSVKDYGTFVAVRLQRGSLQLWTVDVPWAAMGQVVVGNGAELAKEAGLWPADAIRPRTPLASAEPPPQVSNAVGIFLP